MDGPILAVDLGKFKSMGCWYATATKAATFHSAGGVDQRGRKGGGDEKGTQLDHSSCVPTSPTFGTRHIGPGPRARQFLAPAGRRSMRMSVMSNVSPAS